MARKDSPRQADVGGIAAEQLRSIVERLNEEAKALREDIKDVFAEAKGNGYDVKVLRKIIAMRKRDRAEIDEEETILELYLRALGMKPAEIAAVMADDEDDQIERLSTGLTAPAVARPALAENEVMDPDTGEITQSQSEMLARPAGNLGGRTVDATNSTVSGQAAPDATPCVSGAVPHLPERAERDLRDGADNPGEAAAFPRGSMEGAPISPPIARDGSAERAPPLGLHLPEEGDQDPAAAMMATSNGMSGAGWSESDAALSPVTAGHEAGPARALEAEEGPGRLNRAAGPAEPYKPPEVMAGDPTPMDLDLAKKLGMKAFHEDIRMDTIPVPPFRHELIKTYWKAGLKQAHYEHVEIKGLKYWGNKNHPDYVETIDGEPVEPTPVPVVASPAITPPRMLVSSQPQREIIMPPRKLLTPGESVPKKRTAMSKAEIREFAARKNAEAKAKQEADKAAKRAAREAKKGVQANVPG